MTRLFRQAALDAIAQPKHGHPLHALHYSARWGQALLLLAVGSSVSFLSVASMDRKTTVQGYVAPHQGIAKLIAPRAGVIELLVTSGREVVAGQPLLRIQTTEAFVSQPLASNSTSLSASGVPVTAIVATPQPSLSTAVSTTTAHPIDTQDSIPSALYQHLQHSLQQQQQWLRQQQDAALTQYKAQQEQLDQQLAQCRLLLRQQQQHSQILQQRLQLQQHRYQEHLRLQQQGALSLDEQRRQHDLVLQLQTQQQSQLVSAQQQQQLCRDISAKLAQLPAIWQQQRSQFAAEAERLQQQHIEQQARAAVVITAPISGTVTNLMVDAGQSVAPGTVLLSILPRDAKLQAVLLVPTHAFGFIATGQTARLRFAAFPYQRFGTVLGRIMGRPQHILLPGDAQLPLPIHEPVYRVDVELSAQQIRAYQQQIPLQSGMLLSADVVLEQRRLWTWLLDPLLSLRGRL